MSQQINSSATALAHEKIGPLLLRYSLPSIVGMLVASLYNIVDRVYIGQGVGPMAISGLALTLPLMTLVAAIGTLVGVGASSRISIVLGMKDLRWARNILGNALVLTFLLSGILVSVSMIYLDEILVAFGGSEQTIPYAKDYLQIVIPGSILSNLSYSFSGMMRASGFPNKSMYTILIGVGLNIALDPVFIFGFGMGIRGAAIATVVSMLVSAVFVMNHFLDRRHPVHFRRDCFRPKKRIIRNIVSIGMAPFLMNLAASGVNIIMNHQLVREGGDLAIGAYGIIGSFAMLAVMCIMGLCQGMQPIVGYNFGARRYKRMKDVLLLTLRTAFLMMLVGWALAELFPKILVGAFTHDPELSKMAVHGMRIVCLMLPVVGFQIVASTFFQSISKAPKAIFMSLTRQVIFLIPALILFSRWFGLTGTWLAIPFADLLAALIALAFLLDERRAFYGKRSRRA